MKIAVGTVQFGLNYGAFNCSGQVPLDQVRQMLELARLAGVSTLDTAHAYGNSEALLGELEAPLSFRIVTKVPPLSEMDAAAQLTAFFSESLRRLGVQSVHGLLVHRPADLLGPCGAAIWTAMERLRASGQVNFIGFSAYGPDEALAVLQRYPVQLVQLPLSVFDTRHLDRGVLEACQTNCVEVHARSVLLQGFVLSEPEHLQGYLRKWAPLLRRFRARCEELNVLPLQAAVGYASGLVQVAQVVMGVDSPTQLLEVLAAARVSTISSAAFRDLACNDVDLLEPWRWK